MQQYMSKKGRPKIAVDWPQSKFTFKNLLETQRGKLCASSLRNKIKSASQSGELKVVDKVMNNTGRPELVYQMPVQSCQSVLLEEESPRSENQCTAEESTGESTPLG
jgi:hypothetical protein